MASITVTDSVAGFLERLQSRDEAVSTAASQHAGPYGAPAVKSLIALMGSSDTEAARRARRALEHIVHYAGHPAFKSRRDAVEREMAQALGTAPVQVRRVVVWMLSEIGGTRAVKAISGELTNADVREDARCALTRIPVRAAIRALQAAFEIAPEDFRFALAESLRQRGRKVDGYPSRKRVPRGQTAVLPVKAKSA
jgi:HEAT repeat protein